MNLQKQIVLILNLIIITSVIQAEKEAILIIGTGRSGTSCTAFLLKTLGLEMGNGFIEPNNWNPTGFFERVSTSNLNRELLLSVSYDFFRLRYINWNNHPKYEEIRKAIYNHILKDFSQYNQFGIKSPQLAFLLPIYLDVCKELGYKVKLITVLRKTEEIAESFSKLTGEPRTFFYPLICDCYRSIIAYGNSCEQITIDYHDIMNNLPSVVEKINKFIPNLKTYEEVKEVLNSFYDPKLQHYNFSS